MAAAASAGALLGPWDDGLQPDGVRGSPVSPVRWLRAVAVIGATALLMASSCSWQLGTRSPKACRRLRVIRCRRSTRTPRAGPPTSCTTGRPSGRPALGIPVTALEAYAYAARVAEVENPNCHLAWTTLAGIGRWRAITAPTAARRSRPTATSPPPSAASAWTAASGNLRDRRHRRRQLDGDAAARRGRWGRCSSSRRRGGCTGSTPTTTASSARTTSTTRRCRRRVICAGAERISRHRAGWMNALRAYNLSDQYARTVRDWATAYADGPPAVAG